MYCPPHYREERLPELVGLIEEFPLAAIVCDGPDGLAADHVPLMHEGEPGTLGKLIGHVARSNPLWQLPPEQSVLVIFQGPSAYISPNWYATKPDGGRVVPTWNYAVVHASCTLHAIHDPQQILQIVTRLTDKHERSQAHPWRVSDAPSAFLEKMVGGIVGIELGIDSLHGKWKLSQNQPVQNRQSVVEGLLVEGSDAHTQMATLVRVHGAR